MRKVRVLETIRQGKIGGGESHVLDLVKHLDKDKFEPVVLSFTNGKMIDCLNEIGIANHIIHTERPFDFTKWKAVKGFLKEQKVDIVHAHGTRANTNVLWAARSLGLPIIYTIHGWSFHDDQKPVIKKFRIQTEKYLTSRTNLNIAVSQSNKDTGKNCFGTFEAIVINNGINLDRFDPKSQYKNIRAEYGIPQTHTLLGYIARITKQKDPHTMLMAMKGVLKQNADVTLLMVGDGDLKDEAEAMATELGIDGNVIFAGYRTDIPDLLNAFDIYCLPSLWEGLPIGLMEAMAMGKAAIATQVDGSKEMIDHNQNGLLINPRDAKGLAEAINKLHSNPRLRKAFGENALHTVREKYEVGDMVRKIEKEYENILKL